MLVKRETTSKLIRMSEEEMAKSESRSFKGNEFFMYESIFWANGWKYSAKNGARFFVGEPIALTIVRSGMSALWILGSPYNFGMYEDLSQGIRICFASFPIGALRMSERVFFSKYVVGSPVVSA